MGKDLTPGARAAHGGLKAADLLHAIDFSVGEVEAGVLD